MDLITFNINNGYIEGIVRGLSISILKEDEYN